jgi:RHS repeat-associated protein
LTTDTLGSPRINTDAFGLVKARHDYMPFGEEINSGTGGRTTQQGYGGGDSIRQKFTQKERDNESGLDYFINRYYSSAHGRFTSVDPGNAGADEDDPQSLNGYAYARSNPVLYTDPDGLAYIVCDPNGKNCSTVTDQQFYDARRADTKAGLEYTGNRDFFEGGQIKVDGQVQYTYQQISIDDPQREFIFQMRRQTAPIPKATLAFFGLSAALGTGGGVAYYYLGAAAVSTGANLVYRGYRALNVIEKALKSAKQVGDRLEATLKDGSKVIFRKDFGPKAHPIGSKYPNPVNHYNIEIHVPYRGGYKVTLDVHVIVDSAGKVIDIITK